MAEQVALARAVIAVEGDATQLIAQMASAETAVNDFSRASKESIGKAVAALSGLGNEAATEFEKLSSASRRAVTQLALQTGRLQVEAGKLSADTFRQLELIVKGTSATIAEKYVGALSRAAAEAKNLATEQNNLTTSATASGAALATYDATLRNARVSANQLRTAYAQLPAQITDVVTSLASGIPAYLVLIQQGGQIKDSFGGIGNAAKALVAVLSPAKVVLTGFAASFAALVFAYYQARQETEEFNKAIILSGNIVGASVGQLNNLARGVGQIVGTQGKAASVLAQLAASGQIAASNLGLVAEAAIRLEKVAGISIDATVKQFAALTKEPADAALKLNESTNFLTVSLYKQIRALEDSGRAAEAAAIAQREFALVSIARAKELESGLGTLERSWNFVADAAKKAWDRILDVGREESIDQRLQNVNDSLARFEAGRAQQGPQRRGTIRFTPDQELSAQYVASLREEQAYLQEQVRLANRVNAARQDTKNAVETTAKIEDLRLKYLTEEEKYAKEILNILSTAGGDIAAAQELIGRAADKYNSKNTKQQKKDVDEVQKSYERLVNTLEKDIVNATAQLTGVQQNLTASQVEYLKVISSPYYIQYNEGQKELLRIRYLARDAIFAELDAENARKKAIEESSKALKKTAEDEAKRTSDLTAKNQELINEIIALGNSKEASAELEAQRLRTNAAALEGLAIVRELTAATDEERQAIASLNAQAAQNRLQADLIIAKAAKQANIDLAKANDKAAEEAYKAWAKTIDDISKSLADAIIEGGKSAARVLKNIFSNLILKPIIQASLQPLIQSVAGALGFTGAAAATTLDGGTSAVKTAQGLISAATTVNAALTAFSGGISVTLGNAAIAAGKTFGSTALQQYGMGLSGSVGPVAPGTAGATGLGAASSSYVTAAAGIAAGVLAGRAISGGYSALGGRSGNAAVNTGTTAGAIIGAFVGAPGVGAAIGGAIGGLVNRAFGRKAPEITGTEIAGTFKQGQFAGDIVTTVLEKGGWFRGDKITEQFDPIVGDLDKALDEGGRRIAEIARKYGAALGLPVEELANVSTNIRVKITDNVEDNNKAIEAALTEYGKLLFESFADELEPLRLAGEEISTTIERVGGAILGVNTILENIGQEAIAFSVEGGKAAIALTDLFGGAQAFAQATSDYYTRFFDESERVKNSTAQIGEVFKSLNLSVPTTKEQFKELVQAQDLTTDAGRQTFAALISIAGVFDDVTTAAQKAAKALNDAVEALRERFRTPEQSRAAGTQRIAGELIDLGVLQGTVREVTSVLEGATRESILAFVENFITLGDVSDETKTTVANLAGALVDLKDEATKAADTLNTELRNAIRSNIGQFQTPEQRKIQPYINIQEDLADVGIRISLEDILGASKQEIFDYAKAIVESGDVSNDAKIAVVNAAGALAQLSTEADQLKLDEILAEIGDIDVLKGKTKTLSEQYLETVASIEELETGLAKLTGTVDQSIQEILQSLLDTQKGLNNFRQSLSTDIEEARLRSLSPEARVQALREEEARLFAELRTAADPVAVAQQLQKVVISRIKEEASIRSQAQKDMLANAEQQVLLTKEARDAQIDAYEAQIDALERLKNLAEDIAQFTGSLRFSDISPLNYEDQLNAARQLFETTLSAAQQGDPNAQGNLIGNAKAFLDEARAYYASSGAYAAIFGEVTGALDALGLTATQADPQIAALEAQIEALKSFTEVTIETSAEEVAGLTAIRDALDIRISENSAAINRQIELAQAEIDERKADRDAQAVIIRARAQEAADLKAKIDNIDLNLGKLVGNSDLASAAPVTT